MDKFQSCDLEDAEMLAARLNDGANIVFSFSIDRCTSYVMMIVSDFDQIGVLPFGGQSTGCFYVGLLMKGFFHIDFRQGEKHHNYIWEKLGLRNETDAKQVTEMLNAISASIQSAKHKDNVYESGKAAYMNDLDSVNVIDCDPIPDSEKVQPDLTNELNLTNNNNQG